MMKGKVLTIVKEYLILTIASFIFAAAWECFMIPNGMSAGGMMGLCTIIQYATADLIPAQVSYIAINAVLMVVAVLAMGIGFGFKTIYCIVVSTLAMGLISGIEVLHSVPGEFFYIEERVLVPIFAGVLEALGIGLILRYGGSTGGSDIVALMVNKYWPVSLSTTFLIMGVISSFIMGWGPNTIAEKMANGFKDIAVACLMIGIARGILVILQSGHIIDTVVYGLSIPLTNLPGWLSSIAMLIVQTLINFLIPSGSGQAVTSMPIMAPLADLVGISRQTSILAFQFGDGLSNVLWPTASAPIICGIAGIKIEKWWKWFVPLFLLLLLTQAVLVAISTIVWPA